MPNCAPTKKQMKEAIISIFMNARPVTHMSVLCVRRSAIRDMMWFMRIMITPIVFVEKEEMNHARYGNKGCRVFKRGYKIRKIFA